MKDAKKREVKVLKGFRLPPKLVERLEIESETTKRSEAVIIEIALESFFGSKKRLA